MPLNFGSDSESILSPEPAITIKQMPSSTIKDAASLVSSEAGGVLSVLEITRRIADRLLFTFEVAQPKHVVKAAQKRHAVAAHPRSSSKQPGFREADTKSFELYKFGEQQKSSWTLRPLWQAHPAN